MFHLKMGIMMAGPLLLTVLLGVAGYSDYHGDRISSEAGNYPDVYGYQSPDYDRHEERDVDRHEDRGRESSFGHGSGAEHGSGGEHGNGHR